MTDVAKVIAESGPGQLIAFRCPGCDNTHAINSHTWTWNGDLERPTFDPSVKVGGVQWPPESGFHKPNHAAAPGEPIVCHSFVRDGRIQFLSDSTHTLAGQTVDLPPWRDDHPEGDPDE